MADAAVDDSAEAAEAAEASEESSESDLSTKGLSVDALRLYLAKQLGFYKDDEEEQGNRDRVRILDELNLEGIVKYIKDKDCRNVITMAGAGISTAAGIPDFRSPVSGLYHNLLKYNLPHPQAIFELDFFEENPKPFFELAKELYPGCFKPTLSHYFIRLLHEKGLLLRHYTQNIDTLERVAGVPDDKLVEAHGTFHIGHCLRCGDEYTQDWMRDKIFKDEIPICESCPGVVKPDIIFFGENLPTLFHDRIVEDFPKCDLLVILGSSLVVQPFASLIDRVPSSCPRLLINREKAGHRTGIMAMMGMKGGMDFDSSKNSRDVAYLGNCDEGCEKFAQLLGFDGDFKELVKMELEKIDLENSASTVKGKTSKKTQENVEEVLEIASNSNKSSSSPEKLDSPGKL